MLQCHNWFLVDAMETANNNQRNTQGRDGILDIELVQRPPQAPGDVTFRQPNIGTPNPVDNDTVFCGEDTTVYSALPAELAMFTNPGSVLDAFWMFVNYCFLLCLFPFRISRDKSRNHHVMVYKPQKIICTICHILLLVFWIKKIRTNPEVLSVSTTIQQGNSEVRTEQVFAMILALVEIAYVLALMWTVWTKSFIFEKIGNAYHRLAKFEEQEFAEVTPVDESLPVLRLVVQYAIRIVMMILEKRYMVGLLLCVVYTALGLKDFWDEFEEEIREEKSLFGPEGYVTNATKEFFFIPTETYVPSFVTNPLSVIYGLVSLNYSLIINLGNLFYGILALMLANLGNNFETLLDLPDVTGTQIIGEFKQVKDFVRLINEELGVLTLFVVVSAVPYYATVLPSVLNADLDRIDRFVYALNLAHYGLVLYLTSTLQEKVRRITVWFSEKEAAGINTGITTEHQRLMREEISDDAVALSALGFFGITYSTIGRILQLLMTYGFIAGETFSGFRNNTSGVEDLLSAATSR